MTNQGKRGTGCGTMWMGLRKFTCEKKEDINTGGLNWKGHKRLRQRSRYMSEDVKVKPGDITQWT